MESRAADKVIRPGRSVTAIMDLAHATDTELFDRYEVTLAAMRAAIRFETRQRIWHLGVMPLHAELARRYQRPTSTSS
jgi:hypothetical protein